MKPSTMTRWQACMFFLMTALFTVATAPVHAQETLQVVVSTHPLARLVNSTVPADAVTVVTLLERGVTPHDATLRPRQLQQLSAADLVIWMGPEVEPYLAAWMKKRSGPTLDISTLTGIERLPLRKHAGHDHGHTHQAHHDIHLWWSRQNMRVAANALAERLMALRPDLQDAIALTHTQFSQDMTQLEDDFASEGAAVNAIAPFAVFHDGWQYLEHDLGRHASAGFVLDGELSMGVRHLAHLQQHFKRSPVACVLLEPGMNTALVSKILPTTPTVTLDPLGWDAPGQGVVDMFRHAYQQLQACGQR